ncbi:hypothetical protein DFH06DRAFT_1347729 [Mycena polygramma]|nr:hypothetical protein DFH06DRAFT_1347729 [Mycena polygramma]
MVVISIIFANRDHVSISHATSAAMTVTESLPGPYQNKYNFFIDSRVMGFRTDLTVTFWSMDASAQPWIKRYNFETSAILLPCLTFGQNVYLLSPAFFALDAEVNAMPLASEGSDGEHGPPGRLAKTVLWMPYPSELGDPADFFDNNENDWSEGTSGLSITSPQYGVFAVHQRRIHVAEHNLELVLFHSAHPTGEGDLEFGPGCCYQHAHAGTNDIRAMVVGVSGTYVLLRLVEGQEHCLGLVHYSPFPVPHTSFRKLDVGNVVLTSVSQRQMALDDPLGLVCVVDDHGCMRVISYV